LCRANKAKHGRQCRKETENLPKIAENEVEKGRDEAPISTDYTAHFARIIVEIGTSLAKKKTKNGALKKKSALGPNLLVPGGL
jgi:hypothetical protein